MNHNFQNPYHNGEDMSAMHQAYHPDVAYYPDTGLDVQQQEHVSNASGWYELSCVEAGGLNGQGDAVRKIAFDPLKELFWVGTASGMLHSHYAADSSRVVSSYICEPSADLSNNGDVRDIVVSKRHVLAAVNYGLAMVSRGGVIQAAVRADTIRNATGLALNPISEAHVCIGGESRMLAVIDLEQQRILRQATLRGAHGVTNALWAAPSAASSVAIFSTSTGRLSFCDPSTMREVNAVAAFAGATTSIATNGYYLAATGLGTRGGVSYLEQIVKLFDIRAVDTPLPSVPFSAPPMFVAFDDASASYYNTDGAMWVLSPNGVLQLLDISAVASGAPPFPICDEIQLDAGSDALTSIAVSSQGMLAFGDTGGFIHQWGTADNMKVNAESEPLWSLPITTEPPTPSIRLDDLISTDTGVSIPKCAIPEYDNSFLTDDLFVEEKEKDAKGEEYAGFLYPRRPFARFPLTISDEILNKAKRQSFVGYVQAPHSFVRNSEAGHKKPPVLRKGRRGSLRPDKSPDSSAAHLYGRSVGKVDLSKPAAKSFYVEMDLVAWESIEGFDFLKYNKSALFCGLENALPNVYVNAAVQMLYFNPPIRKAIGSHSCDRDWCISCELGFLFHMFDLGGAGMACEAGNFTRAFMTMANARALGLLDGPHALPLSQRIENFTRYLLEQLRKDGELRQECSASTIFGAETLSHGTFTPSKTKWERKSLSFQHTLTYDSNKMKNTTFCELLQNSLSHTSEPTRAFCEASGQFEMMSQHRELLSLPNILLLGCNTKAAGYSEWWLEPSLRTSTANQLSSSSFDIEVAPTDREVLNNVAERAMERGKKLVESIKLDLREGVQVSELNNPNSGVKDAMGYDTDDRDEDMLDTGSNIADYDLSFVIAHVPPSIDKSSDVPYSGRNVGGHLVTYVRVPLEYRRKDRHVGKCEEAEQNAEASWWCFNDFVISPCEGFEEVAAFDRQWKKPCLLGYVRRDIKKRVRLNNESQAVNVREVIGGEDRNGAIGLQEDEETPGKGTVFALDCEFVMVSRDEADIFEDGTRQVVIPARLVLARVSVIRGSGRLKGTALIDDYVAVREPVVDYLTRFSGISEGDLDVERSRHTVSSLKSVYKRLRCLVDAGCIFVGHGLKSDFRIINFVVPPKQVIDTVTLFRVAKKRLLGLRFLSNALLGGDIQSETHDSIEDCDAALRLYEVYLRLKRGTDGDERFERTLKDLYTYGYAHGWKVDPEDAFLVEWGDEG